MSGGTAFQRDASHSASCARRARRQCAEHLDPFFDLTSTCPSCSSFPSCPCPSSSPRCASCFSCSSCSCCSPSPSCYSRPWPSAGQRASLAPSVPGAPRSVPSAGPGTGSPSNAQICRAVARSRTSQPLAPASRPSYGVGPIRAGSFGVVMNGASNRSTDSSTCASSKRVGRVGSSARRASDCPSTRSRRARPPAPSRRRAEPGVWSRPPPPLRVGSRIHEHRRQTAQSPAHRTGARPSWIQPVAIQREVETIEGNAHPRRRARKKATKSAANRRNRGGATVVRPMRPPDSNGRAVLSHFATLDRAPGRLREPERRPDRA